MRRPAALDLIQMSRRPARFHKDEISRRSTADRDSVSPNDAVLDARAEEERQVREALLEYFSILHEWSVNNRRDPITANRDELPSG